MRPLWRQLLAASVAAALLPLATLGTALGAPAPEADSRRTAAAGQPVPVPELASVHSSAGLNLWRTPLSELDDDYGQPQLVASLDNGGFSFPDSKTVGGDFGDVSGEDDGTADHAIWHRAPDGSVLLWAVGGGTDTTPRLWAELRSGGWSWHDSTPMVGDVNADGWDDLVVVHRNPVGHNVWFFLGDGHRLGPPRIALFGTQSYDTTRFLVADVSGDEFADLVMLTENAAGGIDINVVWNQGGGLVGGTWRVGSVSGGGWSFDASRQLIGDVTGDGSLSLVHVHSQVALFGMLVWVQPLRRDPAVPGPGIAPGSPRVWQDLRTGGWDYYWSRHHLADTDGDLLEDLVSVHGQVSIGGQLLWRHRSTGSSFAVPEVVTDMRSGGWVYTENRESVARLVELVPAG